MSLIYTLLYIFIKSVSNHLWHRRLCERMHTPAAAARRAFYVHKGLRAVKAAAKAPEKGGFGRPQGRRRARRRSRGAGRGVTPAPKMQPDGDGFAMFREMGYNKIRKQSEKFRQKKTAKH